MREYSEIVKLVASFLEENNIPYVIVGAISVAAWGSPRTSHDIDLMVALDQNIEKFVDFLKKNDFHVSVDEVKAALKEKSHFTVFDELSIFRLDVKGVYTEFDKDTLERRRKVKLYDQDIWVSSPEDLILAKINFGSEQDLNDARSVILRQKSLDMNYLRKKARELGMYDKLVKLLKETEENLNKFSLTSLL